MSCWCSLFVSWFLKVIFFGDNVPKDRADKSIKSAKECDAFLVLGSSVMTMSAYRLVKYVTLSPSQVQVSNTFFFSSQGWLGNACVHFKSLATRRFFFLFSSFAFMQSCSWGRCCHRNRKCGCNTSWRFCALENQCSTWRGMSSHAIEYSISNL